MNTQTELKKDGIEVISQIDTLKVNSLAMNISTKICNTFPHFGLNQNELFIKLCRLNMYKANMPEGIAEASYFYKNTSIYFNSNIPDSDLEEFAIHECIHYLQEVRDNKNNLLRMGFSDYTQNKNIGLGLNEASVQLMSSKINNIPKEFVKYYGILFETISPSYYPLQCALVNQLSYLIGEDILFKSTLNSDDNFTNILASIISPKTYFTLCNLLTELLSLEEQIIKLNNKILKYDDRNKKVTNMFQKIDELKNEISLQFFKIQNLIISSYFDNTFKYIQTLEELENYRRKLYSFKSYIGTTEGYTFFDTYYESKMNELEIRNELLENGHIFNPSNLPSIHGKESIFGKIIRILKSFIGLNKNINNVQDS